MSDSFANAASRHRADAKHLAENRRFQNAGHLIGFAAECWVKATLQQQGIKIDRDSGLRVHFPKLVQVITTKGYGRGMLALQPIIENENFLQSWRAELRYEDDIEAQTAEQRWQAWITDVEQLFNNAGIV
jgi:hypothetical protein